MGKFKKIKKIAQLFGVPKNVVLGISFLSILGLIFIPFLSFAAGIPSVINFQGRLTNSSGDLLGGSGTTYYFKFSIWNNATVGSGTRFWPTNEPATTTANVRQGVFNANIHVTDFNFNDLSDAYLQIEVSSDNNSSQTLSPRQRISSSAFANLAGAVSGSTTPSTFGTTTPIGNSVVTIEATSTTATLLSLRAISGQAVNLLDIQNSAGSGLVFINSSGGIFASSTLQVTGNSIFYGDLGIASTSPGSRLSIESIANFVPHSTSTIYNGLQVSGLTATSSGLTISGGSIFQTGGATSSLQGLQLSSGTFKLPTDLCANNTNGGVLTTDANGNIVCENDDTTGTIALDDLSDVVITAGAYGDLIFHNGTNFVDSATSTLFSTSQTFAQWLSDETGTTLTGGGLAVFNSSPSITTPTFTTSASFGTAGVSVTDDGDGGITFLGLGNGNDENLKFDFDNTANQVVITTTTSVATTTYTAIGIGTAGLSSSAGLTISDGAILQTGGGTSTLANGLRLTAGTFKLPTDLCANNTNGGVLTTDANGNIVCENDDTTGTIALDDLSDVVITAGAYGDLIFHNGTNFVDSATSTLFSTSQTFAQWLSDETGTTLTGGGLAVFNSSPSITI